MELYPEKIMDILAEFSIKSPLNCQRFYGENSKKRVGIVSNLSQYINEQTAGELVMEICEVISEDEKNCMSTNQFLKNSFKINIYFSALFFRTNNLVISGKN